MTPEDKDRITGDILSAFDEMAEEGAEEGNISEGTIEESAPEPEPERTEEQAEEQAEPEEQPEEPEIEVRAEHEPGEDQAESGEQEEDEGEGEQVEPQYSPEIQAFLDRHEGDLAKALASAVEIQKMLSRRNMEHGELTRRTAELEAMIAQAQAFQGTGGLTPEQGEWVEQAIASEQPGAFVQSAVAAGEFDLARAVCDAWGQEDAYGALRTRQMVDEAEYHAQQAFAVSQPPPEFSREELYSLIQEQVPDFGEYWNEMTEIVTQLGQEHPMVAAAKSTDPNEATLGLIDIYKVARTRKARVSEARKQVEDENRERGLAERRNARVSSASSRSSSEEPPRSVRIGPGLTLDQLEEAFAAE